MAQLIRFFAICAIFATYLVLMILLQPFKRREEMVLETVLQISLLMLASGGILRSPEPTNHNYMCHNHTCHNYICHNYICHNYICHNYLCHNYICHNYICHNYICHNYICQVAGTDPPE